VIFRLKISLIQKIVVLGQTLQNGEKPVAHKIQTKNMIMTILFCSFRSNVKKKSEVPIKKGLFSPGRPQSLDTNST
jgi:hypothetical protein